MSQHAKCKYSISQGSEIGNMWATHFSRTTDFGAETSQATVAPRLTRQTENSHSKLSGSASWTMVNTSMQYRHEKYHPFSHLMKY